MPYKHCPRCGGRLRRESPEMLRCLRCKFENYLVPKITVNVILENERGEILLGRRTRAPHRGSWNTVGGHVDPGETAEEAARRETKEECGLRAENLKYLGSYLDTYHYQGVTHRVLALAFHGRAKGKLRSGSDMGQFKFLKPDKVPLKKIAFRSDRNSLRDYLKNKPR